MEVGSKYANPEERHEAFAREWYSNGRNATRAYLSVYPDVKEESAAVRGSTLLRNVKVRAVIAQLEEATAHRQGITFDSIINELRAIAFNDIGEFMDANGKVVAFEHMERDARSTIQELQITSRSIGESDATETQTKLKVYDKLKALDKLCHLLGYEKPKKLEINAEGWSFGESTE